MHRLNLILTFILTASVGLSLPTTSRPNFVFIIGDDISAEDFGCYGNPGIHTPNIDRLAAQGLRFTNAYLTASSCSPSRSSIFTSRYPHNLETAAELHGLLPEGIAMFPKLLRDSGYYTAHAGKAHFGGESDVLSGPALASFDPGGEGEQRGERRAAPPPQRPDPGGAREDDEDGVPEVAQATYDQTYDGFGNWPFNTAYAAPQGFQAFVTRLGSLRDAEAYLQRSIPLAVTIRFKAGELPGAPLSWSNGHVLVLTGTDSAGNVYVNDPAAPNIATVKRKYPRAVFERLWQAHAGGLAYVIVPENPGGKP